MPETGSLDQDLNHTELILTRPPNSCERLTPSSPWHDDCMDPVLHERSPGAIFYDHNRSSPGPIVESSIWPASHTKTLHNKVSLQSKRQSVGSNRSPLGSWPGAPSTSSISSVATRSVVLRLLAEVHGPSQKASSHVSTILVMSQPPGTLQDLI